MIFNCHCVCHYLTAYATRRQVKVPSASNETRAARRCGVTGDSLGVVEYLPKESQEAGTSQNQTKPRRRGEAIASFGSIVSSLKAVFNLNALFDTYHFKNEINRNLCKLGLPWVTTMKGSINAIWIPIIINIRA